MAFGLSPCFYVNVAFNALHITLNTSSTRVLRGQLLTLAPLITQSTQVPYVQLKTLSRQTT